MRKIPISTCCALLVLSLMIYGTVYSQRGRIPQLELFQGITTDGKITSDLFKIKQTGVSTEPVRKAAEAFLRGLTDDQAIRTMFPVNDKEWRMWDNRHFYQREGVGFDEMTEGQRKLAFNLLRVSLSAKGLKKSQDIMKLNGTLAELANNFDEYGEWLYWITIMGEPNATKPWGWQLDGHHLVINYFVLGDQVVMTPVFMGSEPVEAVSGKFKGTIVMQDEQNKGLALINALDDAQRRKAILEDEKGRRHNLTEAYRDNVDLNFAGIPGSDLKKKQKDLLLEVIGEYVGNMSPEHARVKMDEVREHLENTYFAWIGKTKEDSVFYYRIHSPVLLIEFDHQSRVAPFRSNAATREHIHTVLRTPNGNDYGKDLLRQHYEHHHHGDGKHDHKH